MRYVQGRDDDGRPLPLRDPLADTIRAALPDSNDPARVVAALLRLDAVFPAELADDAEAAATITAWLAALMRHGAADTVRNAVNPGAATEAGRRIH
jgi:fructuronate reductase